MRLGVVMDPIGSIRPTKDSTLAMLLEARRRGWSLHYMELGDLAVRDGEAIASVRPLDVRDDPGDYFDLGPRSWMRLGDLDLILMRKDPPVDAAYVAATWILELAEAQGATVVNRPQALRDANEKVATAWFPQCCPASLLTSSMPELHAFLEIHGHIVVKPLDAMGGRSVFQLRAEDPNRYVVLEEMTRRGSRHVLAQAFVEGLARAGDKRILLVDGEPVPHALVRWPVAGDFRANLAAGGRAEGAPLSDRERWICAQVGGELRARGLVFVGLDVIDGYLTEVNVTSPTCIREIDRAFGTNVAGRLLDALAARIGT